MRERLQADGEILDAHTVRFERLLPGPIERVWAYLTESKKRRTWLAAGEMDLRVGGRAELMFNHSELSPHAETPPDEYKKYDGSIKAVWTITRCDPPRLLSLLWGEAPQDSEVTFELAEHEHDVSLTVTHRRLSNREQMLSISSGWHTHLGILADCLNDRTPPPFWATHAELKAQYERKMAR